MLRATVPSDERKTVNKLKKLGFVVPPKGGAGVVVTLIRVIPLNDDTLAMIQKELGPSVTFSRA